MDLALSRPWSSGHLIACRACRKDTVLFELADAPAENRVPQSLGRRNGVVYRSFRFKSGQLALGEQGLDEAERLSKAATRKTSDENK